MSYTGDNIVTMSSTSLLVFKFFLHITHHIYPIHYFFLLYIFIPHLLKSVHTQASLPPSRPHRQFLQYCMYKENVYTHAAWENVRMYVCMYINVYMCTYVCVCAVEGLNPLSVHIVQEGLFLGGPWEVTPCSTRTHKRRRGAVSKLHMIIYVQTHC